ncbi:MAG: phosphatase PAP2 family protein [Chloroflexi bacterium]|nr:phosphatase PAP2 family protein [Chloroflexota bacterium]
MGVIALVSLVLFACLGALTRAFAPAGWELMLVGAAASLRDAPAGTVLAALNAAGELQVWGPAVVTLGMFALLTRRTAAGVLILLTLVADLVSGITKLLVERPRPDGATILGLLGEESFAYPSGHVVRAAALVGVLMWLALPRRWRVLGALGAALAAGALMGLARVALGVHWPTDALGGAALGVGWFAATAALVPRARHRIRM